MNKSSVLKRKLIIVGCAILLVATLVTIGVLYAMGARITSEGVTMPATNQTSASLEKEADRKRAARDYTGALRDYEKALELAKTENASIEQVQLLETRIDFLKQDMTVSPEDSLTPPTEEANGYTTEKGANGETYIYKNAP